MKLRMLTWSIPVAALAFGAAMQVLTTEVRASFAGGEPCPYEYCVVEPEGDVCEPVPNPGWQQTGCRWGIEFCKTDDCYQCGKLEWCWDE